MSTATVQAQSTPIPSTHELNDSTLSPTKDDALQIKDSDSLSKIDSSPPKDDPVSTKDDPLTTDDITAEHTGDVNDDPEPKLLSPPVKADEVSVGHPTYHFVRSRDVPKKESTAIKANPPSTLRSPKQQQRPTVIESPESTEKKEVAETETKESFSFDASKSPPGNNSAEVDQNTPVVDSPIEDKVVSEAEDKPISEDSSSISISTVATSEASEPVPSSDSNSSKQKKPSFSLFKKKTPKYSYILSAQKEFSRKSETARQRTSSNPPEATDKAKSQESRDFRPR
jgi:hypothetical protein